MSFVNAIYFKGSWKNEFSKSATKPDAFHSADGTTKEIDFMNQTNYFEYGKTDYAEIVKLPYKTDFYIEDENGTTEEEIDIVFGRIDKKA